MNTIYDSNNLSKSVILKISPKRISEDEKIERINLEEKNNIACWFNYTNKSIFSNDTPINKKTNKSLDIPSKRWGHSSLIYNNNMVIFGGRYSTKNLANIFAFNLENYFWYKIEPIGQIPPARDSHTIILV